MPGGIHPANKLPTITPPHSASAEFHAPRIAPTCPPPSRSVTPRSDRCWELLPCPLVRSRRLRRAAAASRRQSDKALFSFPVRTRYSKRARALDRLHRPPLPPPKPDNARPIL